MNPLTSLLSTQNSLSAGQSLLGGSVSGVNVSGNAGVNGLISGVSPNGVSQNRQIGTDEFGNLLSQITNSGTGDNLGQSGLLGQQGQQNTGKNPAQGDNIADLAAIFASQVSAPPSPTATAPTTATLSNGKIPLDPTDLTGFKIAKPVIPDEVLNNGQASTSQQNTASQPNNRVEQSIPNILNGSDKIVPKAPTEQPVQNILANIPTSYNKTTNDTITSEISSGQVSNSLASSALNAASGDKNINTTNNQNANNGANKLVELANKINGNIGNNPTPDNSQQQSNNQNQSNAQQQLGGITTSAQDGATAKISENSLHMINSIANNPIDTAPTTNTQNVNNMAIDNASLNNRPQLDATQFANQTTNARPEVPAHEQVRVKIANAVNNGDTKINIQLEPANLGKVDVTIDLKNDGSKAMITINADSKDTLDILQRDGRALERALNDAGIKTDSGSLNFNLKGGNGQNQNQFAGQDGSKAYANNEFTENNNNANSALGDISGEYVTYQSNRALDIVA